jgi:hypothetical protein
LSSDLPPGTQASESQEPSRRGIFGKAAAATAVVAVGGVVTEATARALDGNASHRPPRTVVERAAVAPAVVSLRDAAIISVDAARGNDFRLTVTGNHTLGNPRHPAPGQKAVFQVTQGGAGGYTLSYGTAYQFTARRPQPVLSTAAGQTDLLFFVYNAARSSWLFVAFVQGFGPGPADRHHHHRPPQHRPPPRDPREPWNPLSS